MRLGSTKLKIALSCRLASRHKATHYLTLNFKKKEKEMQKLRASEGEKKERKGSGLNIQRRKMENKRNKELKN